MRIGVDQRRGRLGRRHMLAASHRTADVAEIADRLVGLHATDSATVVLSAWARSPERAGVVDALDRALYEDRSLLRMHCMRRTLFVVPDDLAPALQVSTTRAVAARERARFLQLLAATGPARDAAWLAKAEEDALAALRRLGSAGAKEITAEVPALQETVTLSPGKHYQAVQRVGSSVLRLLAMDGRVRRGRPIGGWASGQFRFEPADAMPDLDPDDARVEVVRRWLATYGPATTDDIKWWTGWTVGDVRRALARTDTAEVEIAGGPAWVLADDDDNAGVDEPWAALLPSLDPATMGWRHRDWYVSPDLRPRLYDTAGNGGPTVWWNGEIVGAWAQRPDGEIVWRILLDRGADARKAVEAEAENLRAWLAARKYAVRYTTPLAKELTA